MPIFKCDPGALTFRPWKRGDVVRLANGSRYVVADVLQDTVTITRRIRASRGWRRHVRNMKRGAR